MTHQEFTAAYEKAKAEAEAYREAERAAPFEAAEREEAEYLASLECPQDRY